MTGRRPSSYGTLPICLRKEKMPLREQGHLGLLDISDAGKVVSADTRDGLARRANGNAIDEKVRFVHEIGNRTVITWPMTS